MTFRAFFTIYKTFRISIHHLCEFWLIKFRNLISSSFIKYLDSNLIVVVCGFHEWLSIVAGFKSLLSDSRLVVVDYKHSCDLTPTITVTQHMHESSDNKIKLKCWYGIIAVKIIFYCREKYNFWMMTLFSQPKIWAFYMLPIKYIISDNKQKFGVKSW